MLLTCASLAWVLPAQGASPSRGTGSRGSLSRPAAELAASRAAIRGYLSRHAILIPGRELSASPALALLADYRKLLTRDRSDDGHERVQPLLGQSGGGRPQRPVGIGITDTGRLHRTNFPFGEMWTGTKEVRILKGDLVTAQHLLTVEHHEPPTRSDYESIGIKTADDLERVAGERLDQLRSGPGWSASLTEGPPREAIRRQVAAARTLHPHVTGEIPNEDLALLLALHETRRHRGELSADLSLARIERDPKGQPRRLTAEFDETGRARLRVLRTTRDGFTARHWATVADLFDFGIDDPRALHTMITEAIAEIAPEDL